MHAALVSVCVVLVSGAGIERNNRLGVVLSYGDAGKRISARVLRKRCARIIWPPEKKTGQVISDRPKILYKTRNKRIFPKRVQRICSLPF